MSTPGLKNMIVGGVACVGGIVLTVAMSGPGSRHVVFWGAVLFGAIQFCIGFAAHQRYLELAPADRPIRSVAEGMRTVIAALAGVIRNPQAPSAAELAAIHSVLRQSFKATVGDGIARDVAVAMLQEPKGLAGYLAGKNAALDPALRALILRGCLHVMRSDGADGDAMPKLIAMGQALGMSDAQVQEQVRDMTVSLDGKPVEITLAITPDDARDGKRVHFKFPTLIKCPACEGHGCGTCTATGRVQGERTLAIDIPAGVADRGRLKCDGQGESPMPGGRPGDLFINLAIEPAKA